MREVIETRVYKKDFKKSIKQNKDLNKLLEVLEKLILDINLEPRDSEKIKHPISFLKM